MSLNELEVEMDALGMTSREKTLRFVEARRVADRRNAERMAEANILVNSTLELIEALARAMAN